MRRNVKVSIYNKEGTYGIPDLLSSYIDWLKEKLNGIPEEYRSIALIDFEHGIYYDSSYISIEIYYYRPESDEELARRLRMEDINRERSVAIERQQYEMLKKKFES